MIVAKVSIKDSGKFWFKKLAKRLEGFDKAYVTVGVHEDAGSYPGGSPTVAEVALWNEFGTRYIPERSFLRSTIDENSALIDRWREEAISKIIAGKWSVEKALEALGFRVQVLVQNKIRSNVPPPNAPATVAQKAKYGVPPQTLINTGLMLRSVAYRVVLG